MEESYSFGAWLKQRRKVLDLTQAELAQHLGCATVTLQKIELDERRPSKQLVERLAEVLNVLPTERPAFLTTTFAPTPTTSATHLRTDSVGIVLISTLLRVQVQR